MDVVQKLRYQGRQYAAGQFARGGGRTKHWMEDAADEIDRLRAENERLRTALIRLRDCDWTITLPDRMDAVREIARKALAAGGE